MRKTLLAAALTLFLGAAPLAAHSSHHGGGHHAEPKSKCVGCVRNSNGKIARSSNAKTQFRKTHPCPATGRTMGACPGYVIDHIVPLKRGGSDTPSNMQWQTKAAAKAKDRVE